MHSVIAGWGEFLVDIVVIGAGPYGLSIAAHLRQAHVSFRVFGKPMMLWRDRMPKGMLLKSDGFATNLSAPGNGFSLERFYHETGRGDYSDIGLRIPLKTLVEYGLEFQRRCVGSVDEANIVKIRREATGFELVLDTGEQLFARKIIAAVGPLAFKNLPATLEQLPADRFSHSSDHHELQGFSGRRVVVVGGGQSALETAALLREQGAEVTILARRPIVWFDPAKEDAPQSRRSALARVRRPNFGLGPGWRTWFWSEAPYAFRYLPAVLREARAYATFGPAGSGWLKHRVDGLIPITYGHIFEARERGGEAILNVQGPDGHVTLAADHVVAATGYKTDVRRLPFLGGLSDEIRTIGGAPFLNKHFESSVAGLHFAGYASAPSFGPSMRFIYGARFAATQLARSMSHMAASRMFAGGFATQETA